MKVEFLSIDGLPWISAGDDLATIIVESMSQGDAALMSGDVLVIAQKIVSKSEGRLINLADVTVSSEASALAIRLGKDERKIQLVLDESTEIVRTRDGTANGEGVLIVRHRLGFILANAGIDESNISEPGHVLLLPEDPDASATRIRKGLNTQLGVDIAVIVTDTFGRPWRNGLVDVAIGVSGCPAIIDLVETADAFGRTLRVSNPAIADAIAAGAGILMRKDALLPAVIVRGLEFEQEGGSAKDLLRNREQDMFL